MSSEDISNKILVNTDGGSRGNPGPAAIGVVFRDGAGHIIKSYGEAIGTATNNQAEYQAVVFAMQKLKALLGTGRSRNTEISFYLDSELVVRQLTGKYKIETETLFPLFIKIWNLKMDFKEVSFQHVPREKNQDADRMVNEALDGAIKKLF